MLSTSTVVILNRSALIDALLARAPQDNRALLAEIYRYADSTMLAEHVAKIYLSDEPCDLIFVNRLRTAGVVMLEPWA